LPINFNEAKKRNARTDTAPEIKMGGGNTDVSENPILEQTKSEGLEHRQTPTHQRETAAKAERLEKWWSKTATRFGGKQGRRNPKQTEKENNLTTKKKKNSEYGGKSPDRKEDHQEEKKRRSNASGTWLAKKLKGRKDQNEEKKKEIWALWGGEVGKNRAQNLERLRGEGTGKRS